MSRSKKLEDAYRFPGFRPVPNLQGIFGDARVITLTRHEKKRLVERCGLVHRGFYDRKRRRVQDLSCGGFRIFLDLEVRRVDCRRCGKVKQEKISFLADNPFYTKRFAYYMGRRCRSASIQSIAMELFLDWHQAKELDKQYMQEQLRRAGRPAPVAIGVDEISIRKGHTYRIVVSDLVRKRPIWFASVDRSEESMDLFFKEWGKKQTGKIRLAVVDMWKPFRNSTLKHCSNTAILFDKFHVMKHLGDALDKVRSSHIAS